MAPSSEPVVIIGGRPAGAALAAHLGARGVPVVLLDRDTFPSVPNVPSSPTIHPGTMKLLDALDIPESAYQDEHARIRTFTFDFGSWWTAVLPVPTMHGRDYLYGVDRQRFDHALWENVARFPSVTRRQSFTVTELLRDAQGRVCGVAGHGPDGAQEKVAGSCVVGADGRFSLVARKAGAPVLEEEKEHLSTVYYADWEGVAPAASGARAAMSAPPGGAWTSCSSRCRAGGTR